MTIQSYVLGEWFTGSGDGAVLHNAVNGDSIGRISSQGLQFADVLDYGRRAGPALQKLSLHDRANRLKALAKYLLEKKQKFYQYSAWTGATKTDSWIDIEGGIGTLFSYSGTVRRECADEPFIVEGGLERLSAQGSFVARHILVPKQGVAVHINAFNFPCWGMLEKIAPSLAAGMPVIVKPASVSCYLTEIMVREIIASNIFPEGSIQLICGGVGDLFEHLTEQDVVTFTGSASTGRMLKQHPAIINHSIPFNMEADSLNACILGEHAVPKTVEFDLFIKEVAREMTVKAGQKCTAIRRIIVPSQHHQTVIDALTQRLDKVKLGDPQLEGVKMGPLVGKNQRGDVWQAVKQLQEDCDTIIGANKNFSINGGDYEQGAYFPCTLLSCEKPLETPSVHTIEAFGPVSTVMPYHSLDEAIAITRLGRGSLVASVFTPNDDEARQFVLSTAAYHGRILVINGDCAKESTGHGSPLPNLVHGGPGRAGGGEELGGLRAVKHYMQRTSIQGSPTTLMNLCNQYMEGAKQIRTPVHPFRKYFDELQIGESLTTHRRTVTETDIVNFACLSGDHFYAHMDAIAAKESMFEKRVVHGYFIVSAAAGMFVDPAPGPVLANYGLESLRFVEPVGIGDTIQVTMTVKQKIKKTRREPEDTLQGVVVWDVVIKNQHDELVALYDILTLVERREVDPG